MEELSSGGAGVPSLRTEQQQKENCGLCSKLLRAGVQPVWQVKGGELTRKPHLWFKTTIVSSSGPIPVDGTCICIDHCINTLQQWTRREQLQHMAGTPSNLPFKPLSLRRLFIKNRYSAKCTYLQRRREEVTEFLQAVCAARILGCRSRLPFCLLVCLVFCLHFSSGWSVSGAIGSLQLGLPSL